MNPVSMKTIERLINYRRALYQLQAEQKDRMRGLFLPVFAG